MPGTAGNWLEINSDAPWDPELLRQAVYSAAGWSGYGRQYALTDWSNDSLYAVRAKNNGTGGLGFWAGSSADADRIRANDAGVQIDGPEITLTGTTIGLTGATTQTGNLLIRNTALTQLALFDVTAGAQKVYFGPTSTPFVRADVTAELLYIGAPATPRVFVDKPNLRVIIGSATALSSATSDFLAVSGGRAYFAPASEELAVGVRYGPTTGSWFLGASNSATPDALFKTSGGVQTARFLNAGGLIVGVATTMTTAGDQLQVTGNVSVLVGELTMDNAKAIRAKESGGTVRDILYLNAVNKVAVGGGTTNEAFLTGLKTYLQANGSTLIQGDTTGLGFFGATPVARPAVAVAATDLPSVITLANDIRTGLINLGLVV